MRLIKVVPAPPQSPKKYQAVFLLENGKQKITGFGLKGYEDYTMHKDRARRERYRKRHEKDLRTNDPTRAGYLSYYLLWGDSTQLRVNQKRFKQMFHLS